MNSPDVMHLETRNVTLEPRWRAGLEERLETLRRRFAGSIRGGRLEILGSVHQRQGRCEIRLVAERVGDTIVVIRHGALSQAMLDEVFVEATRQLGSPMSSEAGTITHGTVLHVRRDRGVGLIRPSRAEAMFVPFCRDAVRLDAFACLEPGDPVTYLAEVGDDGPRAVWVEAVL